MQISQEPWSLYALQKASSDDVCYHCVLSLVVVPGMIGGCAVMVCLLWPFFSSHCRLCISPPPAAQGTAQVPEKRRTRTEVALALCW